MKTVIEMALEAGLIDFRDPLSGEYIKAVVEDLTAFAELVRADAIATEREACAGLCDRFANRMMSAEECADAIRARSCPPCNEDCEQGRNCPLRSNI